MIMKGVISNEKAQNYMDLSVVGYLKDKEKNDNLIDPSFTGGLIANMALENEKSLSGKFVEWNDPVLLRFHPGAMGGK
jgi:hypothetical protein